MKYEFPHITHISQVLPAIEGSNEFIVAEKDGYTVINYVVSTNDTFPPVESEFDAIRRECRGLIFGNSGEVIARRYHKFFNVNEREETQIHNIDLSEPHIVLEKLDGSMITPIPIGDNFRWGTKMGVTEVALPVEVFVAERPNYVDFARACAERNLTPIFEWVSRKQQIVLDYPEDNLILTAIRDNQYGFYFNYEGLQYLAKEYNVPVVKAFRSNINNLDLFINELSKMEGTEGVVLRFDDGHMFKIKTEWYVRIHKAKELILREHDVCLSILENTLDDAKAFLPQDDLDKIERYETNLMAAINQAIDKIDEMLQSFTAENLTRKDFALNYTNAVNEYQRGIIFRCWDNRSREQITKFVFDTVKKNCNKAKPFEDMKNNLLQGLVYN